MHGGERTIRAVNNAILENNFGPLFEHYTNLPELKSGTTTFNTIGPNGEFPIRQGSTGMGVDHIVQRHGKEFAQQGYANSSEGVMSALRDYMVDGKFLGHDEGYSQTFWSKGNSNKVSNCVCFLKTYITY